MAALKLFWLGSPVIELDGQPVSLETRKATALLAYLSVTGQSHSRETLAALFWPEFDQQRALANLRRILSSIQQSIGKEFLLAERENIGWQGHASVWVDVGEFHLAISGIKSHPHNPAEICAECQKQLQAAVDLYRGDFLAGFNLPDAPEFDDWQFFQRDGLRQQFASALQILGQRSAAANPPEPLIQTKLHIPQPRHNLVPRPDLLAQLDEGIRRAFTLICAPAGYGKTTVLAEFIAEKTKVENPACFGWISLDEGDNDPLRFLAYLIAALESARPGMGDTARAMLHSFPPPPPQTILATLINHLNELDFPVSLVLDDYQFISSPLIHQAITFLLEHMPASLHLFVATRSDPALPLARLRARNQLLELRAAHLRFTPRETAEFIKNVMNLSLSPEDILTLEHRTEGWIAGLQMAALSMQGRSDVSGFIHSFSGSHRYILDYLVEETLNRQPTDIQQFLLQTSVLDRFCAPLCDAILANDQSHSLQTLAYLDQANLFLVALDDERRWYRYHHLFADLLKARLKQSQPDRVPALTIRASEWFDQNGFIAEAVQYALSARDFERAAGLIEREGPPRLSVSDPTLLAQAGSLPPEFLRKRPRLGIYQAWLWTAEGRAGAAIPLLRDLARQLPAENAHPELRWMQSFVELLLVYITNPSGKNEPASLPDYEALQSIPLQDLGLRNVADVLYALLLSRREEPESAAVILLKCIQRDEAAGGTTAIPLAIPFLARLRLMQGKLHEAANLCREYMKPIERRGQQFFYAAGGLNIVLGETLREWNDLEGAEKEIRAGIQANEPWNNLLSDLIGYSALARVQQARGDLEGAFETVRKLELLLEGRTIPPDQANEISSLKVRLWLEKGDLVSAETIASQLVLPDPPDFRQELDRITVARLRLAQGRFAEAQNILEGLAQMPGAEKRANRQLKINLLLAAALSGQNLYERALQLLETCLSLAEPDGHVRVFLDTGQPIQTLLTVYLRRSNPPYKAYAHKLLAEFARPAGRPAPAALQAGLVEPLTAREREVLALLAEGCSNRQIADKLVLSEGTIKFHVHSVLEKFGVQSRMQAIAKAKKLDLI